MKPKAKWMGVLLALLVACLWAPPAQVLAATNPVLEPIGNKAVPEGALLEIQLTATDPVGAGLHYSVEFFPWGSPMPAGAALNSPTGVFRWRPQYGQAGTYWFRFTVMTVPEEDGLHDEEVIKVTVRPKTLTGTLQYSTDLGWSLQTKSETLPLPDDDLGQFVAGMTARTQLDLTGEPALNSYEIVYKGTGVDLKLNGHLFDLASPKVASIPSVVMGLRVYNETCQRVIYSFPTSQRYDFEISDGSGALVWRWSDDKAFEQVLSWETLLCNLQEELRYYAKFPLLDGLGQPTLAPGLYRVRGWLTDGPILDQVNARKEKDCGYGVYNIRALTPFGQQFTPAMPSLVAIDLALSESRGLGPTTVVLNVREDTIDGPVVGSSSFVVPPGFHGSDPDDPGGWARFSFEPPLSVTPGRIYVIEVEPPEIYIGWHAWSNCSGKDSYPGGDAIYEGHPEEGLDLNFRTYGPGTGSVEAAATFRVK